MPEIVAIRTRDTDDRSHVHVDLVGYHTDHVKGEPIMISTERAIGKMLYERFWMATPEGEVEIVSGKCSVCGHEPYLRTAADEDNEEKLLDLPEM